MRPVVLTFVRHYLPGFKSGGPVRTISNLVETLGDEIDFRIVTSDRDATDDRPYPDIAGRTGWRDVGRAKVLYLRPDQRHPLALHRIVQQTPHHTLYVNSFLDPVFSATPLLVRRFAVPFARRYIIAPRGEFSESALRLKSAKKRSFMAVAKVLGLHRDLIWQASSDYEAEDIKRTVGIMAKDIRVVANLPAPHTSRSRQARSDQGVSGSLKVIFLARISPMKNLDYALEVLGRVRYPVNFHIYGPVRDDAYWARCRELMDRLPSHVSVTYRGSVDPEFVPSVLARYDVFFLPTLGENYGHAIFESLAAGTPVLIADTTPWRNLASLGVGWDLPLNDPGAFANKIDRLSVQSGEERAHARARAESFAESKRTSTEVVVANRKLFAETSSP